VRVTKMEGHSAKQRALLIKKGMRIVVSFDDIDFLAFKQEYPGAVPDEVYIQIALAPKAKNEDNGSAHVVETVRTSFTCFYYKLLKPSHKEMKKYPTICLTVSNEAPWGQTMIQKIKQLQTQDQAKAFLGNVKKHLNDLREIEKCIDWFQSWICMCQTGVLVEFSEHMNSPMTSVCEAFEYDYDTEIKRARIYKLWRKYNNLALTKVPMDVWLLHRKALASFLEHPSNIKEKEFWSGGSFTSISYETWAATILFNPQSRSSASRRSTGEGSSPPPSTQSGGGTTTTTSTSQGGAPPMDVDK